MIALNNIFYAYIYRDPSRDNESIYVGKGVNKRAWYHPKRKGRHPFIQRLNQMKKNNIEPSIEIIHALDESHAFLMEECLIGAIGRKDLGKGSLLNLTNGGEGSTGHITSDNTKKKQSKAATGRLSSKKGKQFGPQHTAESKLKISKANKNKILSEESKQKVRDANIGLKKSDTIKQKISISHQGRKWYYNPTTFQSSQFNLDDIIPDGFILGRGKLPSGIMRKRKHQLSGQIKY